MSTENIPATREEVKRLLISAGVKVAQTEVDGLRVLKCKLDEMHGEWHSLDVDAVADEQIPMDC